jgi:hypothetical protein
LNEENDVTILHELDLLDVKLPQPCRDVMPKSDQDVDVGYGSETDSSPVFVTPVDPAVDPECEDECPDMILDQEVLNALEDKWKGVETRSEFADAIEKLQMEHLVTLDYDLLTHVFNIYNRNEEIYFIPDTSAPIFILNTKIGAPERDYICLGHYDNFQVKLFWKYFHPAIGRLMIFNFWWCILFEMAKIEGEIALPKSFSEKRNWHKSCSLKIQHFNSVILIFKQKMSCMEKLSESDILKKMMDFQNKFGEKDHFEEFQHTSETENDESYHGINETDMKRANPILELQFVSMGQKASLTNLWDYFERRMNMAFEYTRTMVDFGFCFQTGVFLKKSPTLGPVFKQFERCALPNLSFGEYKGYGDRNIVKTPSWNNWCRFSERSLSQQTPWSIYGITCYSPIKAMYQGNFNLLSRTINGVVDNNIVESGLAYAVGLAKSSSNGSIDVDCMAVPPIKEFVTLTNTMEAELINRVGNYRIEHKTVLDDISTLRGGYMYKIGVFVEELWWNIVTFNQKHVYYPDLDCIRNTFEPIRQEVISVSTIVMTNIRDLKPALNCTPTVVRDLLLPLFCLGKKIAWFLNSHPKNYGILGLIRWSNSTCGSTISNISTLKQ